MNSPLFLHIRFWEYQFYAPHWLWLLLLIPILLFLRYYRLEKSQGVMKFPRPAKDWDSIAFSPIKWMILTVYALIGVRASFLIIALALPYLPYAEDNENYFDAGSYIIISMDISGSMMATDFLPNRLEAAVPLAKDLLAGRKSDRVGFVVFE